MATKIKSPVKKTGPDQGWTHQPGDEYQVTGYDRDGKRISFISKSWQNALAINVWNGTRWLLRDGHRHIIHRVRN